MTLATNTPFFNRVVGMDGQQARRNNTPEKPRRPHGTRRTTTTSRAVLSVGAFSRPGGKNLPFRSAVGMRNGLTSLTSGGRRHN